MHWLKSVLFSETQNQLRYLTKCIEHVDSDDDEWTMGSSPSVTSIDFDDNEPMLEVEISDLLMISDDSDQGSRKFLGNDGMGLSNSLRKMNI